MTVFLLTVYFFAIAVAVMGHRKLLLIFLDHFKEKNEQ